jgi:hypothetical protein
VVRSHLHLFPFLFGSVTHHTKGPTITMGFLGILEDKHLTHVPATVVLSEERNPLAVSEGTGAVSGLKRGTGKDVDIILIPQP